MRKRLNKGCNGEVKDARWELGTASNLDPLRNYDGPKIAMSALVYSNKIDHVVKQQKHISQFWRLEDQGQGAGRFSAW